MSEFIISMAEYVTAKSLRRKAATIFVPIISRKLQYVKNNSKLMYCIQEKRMCIAHPVKFVNAP